MVQIPTNEYSRLKALAAMDFQLQSATSSRMTGTWYGQGVAAHIRASPPDELLEIARTYGRTQACAPELEIPLEETPTGKGSVYNAVLGELIRRYERVLGSAMRQRDAPPSAEV